MKADYQAETADLQSEIQRMETCCDQRQSELRDALTYNAYGYTVTCRVSDPVLLETADLCAGRYSHCDPVPGAKPVLLCLFVDPTLTGRPVPADLSSRLSYQLEGRYLTVTGQDWVRAFAHVDRNFVVALASPTVAQQPYFLSRYICDNLALHLLMRTHVGPMGHLHASCLYRNGKALLMSGHHNTGKSTTAMRLMEHGYRMLSDSTTFVRVWQGGIELLGYPVGELRLRLDTIDQFPRFRAGGRPAMVRDETKLVFNLRERMPERVAETSVWPERIVICRIKGFPEAGTSAEPMPAEQLLQEVWPESVFADDPEVNGPNLTAVRSLLERASCYRLGLGSDVSQLLETIDKL
jgi:hypothetical protein